MGRFIINLKKSQNIKKHNSNIPIVIGILATTFFLWYFQNERMRRVS